MITTVSRRLWLRIAAVGTLAPVAWAASPTFAEEKSTMADYKQQVVELLKSLETGDSEPLAYINPDKYIQHNLAVGDGLAGTSRPLSISSCRIS